MKPIRIAASALTFCLLLTALLAHAATITGTVTDKTTGKPAAGDAVTLIEPMSGMKEILSATTDARGHYRLNAPGSVPYLIRATHQGVGYFVSAPQSGSAPVIAVYDVAAKVEGVTVDEHVIGMETDNGKLRVVERYSVHNASAPTRTQWSPRSSEVIVPADAAMSEASAQRPGTSNLPTTVRLDAAGAKGHYFFNFPIQPDEDGKGTLFQIQYQLPYDGGKYSFHSEIVLPANTTWIVLPKSIAFTGGSGSGFELSPQDPGVQTYLSRNAAPGKTIEFTVSGSGSFAREAQADQQAGAQPGGGIGAPINTPDPLSKYKWWILGGLLLLLAAAAAFLLRKPSAVPTSSANAAPATTLSGVQNFILLSALKDELFALESEKLAGTLTAIEYADLKAALEIVLKHALKRSEQ